jgi:hypothetical protein
MGPPYSACNYLYDAKVVSATVMYPGGSLDALAHPNATIDLQTGQTYNLTLVVHTSQKTVQNDTGNGYDGSNDPTLYLSFYEIVYTEHACQTGGVASSTFSVSPIGSNRDVAIILTAQTQISQPVNPQHSVVSVRDTQMTGCN